MRLLYVIQRYGPDVAGGAEMHCRLFARRMAERGHDVAVLTSCADSHVTWANVHPPGVEVFEGVAVNRLAVAAEKNQHLVAALNVRVNGSPRTLPLSFQEHWMEQQGPYLPDLPAAVARLAPDRDVVIFFTYLWYTTWAGLPVASSIGPTVLHPTAHDEAALALRLYDTTFRHPWAYAFSSHEEADLVRRRFGLRRPSSVIGIGVDLPPDPDGSGNGAGVAAFRRRYGLGDRPYLLYLGRVEGGKGATELYDFFVAYKARNPGPLALAVIGAVVEPLDDHPDVVCTGYVDDGERSAALRGALALVQPSFYESFSMVLTEAWAERKPILAQGFCDVVAGQTTRAGGGLVYRGFAEFEAAVDRLAGDPGLAARLGASGRRFVERRYSWDAVLGRYERLLHTVRHPAAAGFAVPNHDGAGSRP
jgi:glycosyltransferase involved in cell wall biosynthesis